MFAFDSKLPVSDDQRQWVDSSFWRLSRLLGRYRMLQAQVVLPIDEFFPDHFDGGDDAVKVLVARVCSYMRVDRTQIEVHVLADQTAGLRELLPSWSDQSYGCAGLYMHETDDSKLAIVLDGSNAKDPPNLVATVAHELGHAILLGQKLVGRTEPDMEPLTDLLTVFLGMGVFTANAAARFRQYQDERRIGWSMQRLGYLSEETYGYALARFACERKEEKPAWASFLSTNVKTYFKRSQTCLEQENRKTGNFPIG